MFDYLNFQGSTENPTMMTILLTVFLSFVLSSLIAFTYEKTSRNVVSPIEFMQAMVLMSIVAATVMQAIGDSVARGLGMMGALAVIRFRTSLRNPRNMVFTFASLAVGIATGVYGFVIAVVGTLGFCITAFILRYSPMSKAVNPTGTLKFELPIKSDELASVESVLQKHCLRFIQMSYQIVQPKTNPEVEAVPSKRMAYEYQLGLRNKISAEMLDDELSKLTSPSAVKLKFENRPENI